MSHSAREARRGGMVYVLRASQVALIASLVSACAVSEGASREDDSGSSSPVSSADADPGRADLPSPVSEPAAAGGRRADAAPEPSEAPSTPKDSHRDAPACPAGMARIEGFCIDRYEAHLVSRSQSGGLTRHRHYERPEEGVTYEARSEAGVFPQAYISRVESQSACENVEKRLCTRREWQRACKGSAVTNYPYGARHVAGRCNTEKPHLLTLRFGGDTRRWAYAQFNDPTLDQEPGFLAKTGDYAGCVSDAGVFDLVGNLHEWVSDTADASFKARLDSDGIPRTFQYWGPRNGVFMGGFYSTQGELGPGCTFTTLAHEPTYHDYSTGFRCCADPS